MSAATMQFKKGTKVIATEGLRGVPEGTQGKTSRGVGLTWFRYRVYFDNGVELGSIGQDKLVRVENWAQFQLDREMAAEAAAKAAQDAKNAPVAAPAAAPADAAGGNDRLAALMAKSKAARAKDGGSQDSSAPEPVAEEAPAEAAGNDRLAALMAKSKAAREAQN